MTDAVEKRYEEARRTVALFGIEFRGENEEALEGAEFVLDVIGFRALLEAGTALAVEVEHYEHLLKSMGTWKNSEALTMWRAALAARDEQKPV